MRRLAACLSSCGAVSPCRVSRAFDTFDDVQTAKVGLLDDDLEVWLYPIDDLSAFTLFDGTKLCAEIRYGRHIETNKTAQAIHWQIYPTI
jgi:hypothetical protein